MVEHILKTMMPNVWPSIFWFTAPAALCLAYVIGWYLSEVTR